MKRLITTILCMLTAITLVAQGIPYIRNFPATEYKAHNQNFDIITGADGTVYVANFEGLLYYDNTTWRIIHTPGVTRITAVFRDSKGTIWTGGYNYIGYTKHDEQGKIYLYHLNIDNVFKGEVQWIWEKEGNIFFKASNNNIYSVQNEKIVWAKDAKLPTAGFSVLIDKAHITQIQELEDGLKAISTNGEGLIIVDKDNKELFRITEDNGLCSNNISHITYNRHGMIWGATDNGIFAIAFPSIYTRMTKNEGLRSEVLAIEKLNNQILVGTLSGLYVMDGKTFTPVQGINYACWQLQKINKSTLLAATANGVYRVKADKSVKQLTTANTLSVMHDSHGFYSGETEGIFYHTDNGFKHISNIKKVVKIMKDSIGTIWVQNLYGKIWKAFSPFQLKEDDIATIVNYNGEVMAITSETTKPFPYPAFAYNDIENNTIWLTNSKNKQIYAFKNGEIDKEKTAVVYPLKDYSIRAMLRDGNILWMGGDKGINVVDFSHKEPAKEKPELLIRSVSLQGDSVFWGGYGELPEKKPVLSSKERYINIRYSVKHPSLLQKTLYRHRLNNGKWSAWETETSEEYTNLSYGDYKFEVQACDAFGQLSNIVSYKFYIEIPFYLRWYMNILYVIIFMLIVYYIMKWRIKRLEREKHRLEKVVQERTAEIVKQKDEIEEKSKNLETALTELSETQHQLVRQEKMATVGKLTQGLIDRILNPLNYINNFSKLSEGLVKDVTENIESEKEHMDEENYEDTMDVLGMLKGNLQKVGEHGQNTTRTLKAMEELLKDRSGILSKMSLTTLVQQAEKMLQTYFAKEITQYNIKAILNTGDTEIFINGNAEQLSKSIMSMMANSIYAVVKKTQRQGYAPGEQAEVSLSLLKEDKNVHIRLYDNGIGIEENIIDKIFDPFFTTKTTGEAAGVGLYLCREIAQNHGGDITVHSKKNVFTEFTITIPTL